MSAPAPSKFNPYPGEPAHKAIGQRIRQRQMVLSWLGQMEGLKANASLHVEEPIYLLTTFDLAIRACRRWLEEHPVLAGPRVAGR